MWNRFLAQMHLEGGLLITRETHLIKTPKRPWRDRRSEEAGTPWLLPGRRLLVGEGTSGGTAVVRLQPHWGHGHTVNMHLPGLGWAGAHPERSHRCCELKSPLKCTG